MTHAPYCSRCKCIGVVELSQGQLKTLAKCNCEWGKVLANEQWLLPTTPVDGWAEEALKPWEFRPTEQMKYEQKIYWWRERVRMAEEFWKGRAA